MFKDNTIELKNVFGERTMKMSKFSLLLISLVVAITFVGTAYAAGDYKTVSDNGGTVFIGEEGLDISPVVGTDPCVLEYFTAGQNHLTETPQSTKSVSDPTDFNAMNVDFGGRTGLWYKRGDHSIMLRVSDPYITVFARNSANSDITDKSITRGDYVDFRVETNLNEIASRYGATPVDFPFKIRVESPGGVGYTALYYDNSNSASLLNLPVQNSLFTWSSVNGGHKWDISSKDGSGYRYSSGRYIITAECNVNSLKDNNEKAVSSEIRVTIATDALELECNKETISRGSQFVVTIAGTPSETYSLFVKSPVTGESPKIVNNQDGVTKIDDYKADVKTASSGTRSVGFSTDIDTKAKRWTIRVEKGDKSDEITINIEAGKVTVEMEGSGVYYLGDEIKIVGTNTETDTVYFFITGPNLPSAGGKLTEPRTAAGFVSANVRDDKSFEYKWNTNGLSIDSGSYTVYAVSQAVNKDNLDDVSYDTVSVSFRKPFITTIVTPSNIAAGDKFHIKGDAGVETAPGVAIWIMGKNYFLRDEVSVEDDGTYDYEVKAGVSEGLATGQYFVVVQHPMYNGEFDVYEGTGSNSGYVVGTYPVADQENRKFRYSGSGALQGSDAANALVDAIDDPAIDDTYVRANFMIDQPSITIKPVSTVTIGNEFTIDGITNLAVGNTIIVDVVSASFGPTKKTQSGEFSGFSGSVKVVEGENGWNAFSLVVSSGNFIVDEYIITASSVETSTSGSTTFQVVEFVPTPTPTPTPIPTTPTPVPTTIATPEPTTIPPTTIQTTPPTPTPTPKSPGFGALIALIGIGIVGYLVVYREK